MLKRAIFEHTQGSASSFKNKCFNKGSTFPCLIDKLKPEVALSTRLVCIRLLSAFISFEPSGTFRGPGTTSARR
ncbi:hypothetical protein K443DRAFT_282059 [Laccaria amethystina LaAM-08-1]|uniref:Uncharacterized protein n=1 Tax=Laccaria amethystina LaAM-08-1 TaxID=1095629 RepID=A0A0C9WKQ3_9AGAR|nr:hypothetical protein K443DRAFT_282059 [Laccaria amethystina LaAM-08-1]